MNLEINSLGDILIAAITTVDMYEGYMVSLTSHTHDYDFGSKADLPGCKLPTSTGEAALSKYCVSFAEDERQLPVYGTYPTLPNTSQRGGWDQTPNVPFTSAIYTTHPGDMETRVVIPSGSGVKLYGPGSILSVPSGAFVYSADLLTPGAQLTVEHTAGADRGKLKYGASNVVAEVYKFDTSDASLTFLIK